MNVPHNFNEACKKVPKDMNQDDWKFLVKLFASPEFQARSERNKKKRAKLLFGHRGGSKPFVHHKKKLCVGEIELFNKTHFDPEKGWINEEAEKRYLAMVELQGQPSSEGSRPLSEPEIIQEVLGRRSGYVRGLGWGPRPSRSDGAESSRAVEERAEQHQAMKETASNERFNALETQNQQLQRQLTLVLSILRATPGVSFTDYG